MSRSKDKPHRSSTYGDHEVITPENKLRTAVSQGVSDDEQRRSRRARREGACRAVPRIRRMDGFGVRAARSAPAATSCAADSPMRTRRRCSAPPMTSRAKRRPSAIRPWRRRPTAFAGSSSTRRIPDRIPSALIEQHVDAVRAIYREYGRSDAQKLATTLTKRLREVTDDFLIKENRDRPDVLKQLKSPSIVPR